MLSRHKSDRSKKTIHLPRKLKKRCTKNLKNVRPQIKKNSKRGKKL
jgi:hypothetical protein